MLNSAMNKQLLIVFCVIQIVLLTVYSDKIYAECTCDFGGLDFDLGIEIVATTCPSDNDNETTERTYEYVMIKCLSGNLQRGSVYVPMDVDGGQYTKAGIIQYAIDRGFPEVLVNPSGTHVIALYNTGTTLKVENIIAVANQATESDVFNKYCTFDAGLADSDGEGSPDCLDCAPNDPAFYVDCPIDNCPDDPNKTEPGICGCGEADIPMDNDESMMECQACNNCGPPPCDN